MKNKPYVGQVVYSLNIGNAARNREQKLTEVTVSSVGRKYFKTIDHMGFFTEYHIDTWMEKTNYHPDSCLYVSEQEYYDEKERGELISYMRECFSHYGSPKLSLNTLQQIKRLMEEDNELRAATEGN